MRARTKYHKNIATTNNEAPTGRTSGLFTFLILPESRHITMKSRKNRPLPSAGRFRSSYMAKYEQSRRFDSIYSRHRFPYD